MKIPLERLTIRSSRSSGPGGQNVNKVATRVEIRFHLDSADWIPLSVRKRLGQLQRRRINQAGELVIVSSRHRKRVRNLEDCLDRLRDFIEAASRRPRRRVATKPTRASREKRLREKRRRGLLKEGRRRSGRDEDE